MPHANGFRRLNDVGDNDWPAGGERAKTVPWHLKIFSYSYKFDEEGNRLPNLSPYNPKEITNLSIEFKDN